MSIIKNVLIIPEADYVNFEKHQNIDPKTNKVLTVICVLCDTHSIRPDDFKSHFESTHLIKETE